MIRDKFTVLLSGYAKLPEGISAQSVYGVLAVAVIFDTRTGIILDAEASMTTNLAKRFIAELLVGYNLNDGPDTLMGVFERQYHGNAKRALETAMRMVFAKFNDYNQSAKPGVE